MFELKHDGFRALAVIRGHHCELVSRRGHVYKFPQLAEERAHAVRADEAILDGEIVCLDAQGRSQFYSLVFHREWPYFMAFDALRIDGHDLRDRPPSSVSADLKRWFHALRHGSCTLTMLSGEGSSCFRRSAALISRAWSAKWKDGPYHTDGVTTSWLKIENPAYSQAIGRAEALEGRISARMNVLVERRS